MYWFYGKIESCMKASLLGEVESSQVVVGFGTLGCLQWRLKRSV